MAKETGKEKKAPKWAQPKERKQAVQKDPTQIVRLLNTDLDGGKSIFNGLRRIKGISFQMSNILLKKANIPHSTKTSDLTEDQITVIENMVKDPSSTGIPDHFLNVRRFVEDNESKHLTGSDLDIFLRNHIADMKKLGSYVGVRHRSGKKVRGQRTRSTGRGHKSVGVSKSRAKK